jgi:alanine racemase
VNRLYTSLHNISSTLFLNPRSHFLAADSKPDQSTKKIRDSKQLQDWLPRVTEALHLTRVTIFRNLKMRTLYQSNHSNTLRTGIFFLYINHKSLIQSKVTFF